jgi:hypothetical protein
LKQVEVIGSRAKNWPIRDGIDQARLIASSATDEQQQSTAASRRSTASSYEQSRSRGSTTSATNDPHASLSLFAPRDVNQDTVERQNGPSIAPRSSAKPPSRDLAGILAGDDVQSTPGSAARSQSPRKINGGAPKGGAGSHYGPIRLFDENDNEVDQTTPDKKTNPKKYKHFEFGQGEEAGPQGKQHYNNKHQSQWAFADFVTPEKPTLKVRPHDMRTMAWEEDVSDTKPASKDSSLTQQSQVEKSPTFRPVVHAARPDAVPHFQFDDQNTPAAEKPKYRAHAGGLGLYKDHVLGSDDEDTVKKPLATLTNVNQQGRDKDFSNHYEFTDASPSAARSTKNTRPDENQAKVLKGMTSTWDTYDESPNAASKKENVPINAGRGIKTGGDGMGGSKGTARRWGFGDDSDPEPEENTKTHKKNISQSRKQEEQKSFWDF